MVIGAGRRSACTPGVQSFQAPQARTQVPSVPSVMATELFQWMKPPVVLTCDVRSVSSRTLQVDAQVRLVRLGLAPKYILRSMLMTCEEQPQADKALQLFNCQCLPTLPGIAANLADRRDDVITQVRRHRKAEFKEVQGQGRKTNFTCSQRGHAHLGLAQMMSSNVDWHRLKSRPGYRLVE